MAKYILPKGHLSWSQLQLWNSNKDRYIREYFAGGKRLDTKYLRFGKGIAQMIEDGNYKDVLPDLIVYDKPEFKIETEINGVPILSFIDSYDPTFHVFREYKTGKHPWTQAKVQKHGQLVFYAVALKRITGLVPWECHLDWIETKDTVRESGGLWKDEKVLSLTGKIKSFRRVFSEVEIRRMEDLIEKTAKEIDEAYKHFISEL